MRAYDTAVSSANPVRMALVQMRSEKAAITENLVAMRDYLARASNERADVVVFPEMSITGYADPTRMPGAILSVDGATVSRFLALTRGSPAAVVAGIIEANPGRKPYITQVVARNGRLLGVYRKRNIADDELAWFDAGAEPLVFDHAGFRFGLSVCADIYKPKVFTDCGALGATVMLECAAPGLYGEQTTRDWETGWQWWRGECHEHLGATPANWAYTSLWRPRLAVPWTRTSPAAATSSALPAYALRRHRTGPKECWWSPCRSIWLNGERRF